MIKLNSYKPSNVKEHNLKLIRKIFLSRRTPYTKTELATITGLSVVTINKLIKHMLNTNEVIELQNTVTTGGRKANIYKLNKEIKKVMILTISEHLNSMFYTVAIGNLRREIIFEKKIELLFTSVDAMMAELSKVKDKYEPAILVVGIPGAEKSGEIKISDFKPLLNSYFSKNLQNKLSIPVFIENDCNAATYGYVMDNKLGDEIVSGVYFPPNNPPGSSLIIQGVIYHGGNNLSGEIKYLPIQRQSDRNLEYYKSIFTTIMAMYDPNEIIVFSKNIDKFHESTTNVLELNDLYDRLIIKYSTDFDKFHQRGLLEIALENLDDFV